MARKPYLDEPEFVYRFMSKEEYVAPLLCGEIYLSTIGYCRRVEEDPGEGTYLYDTGTIEGDGSDPDFVKVAANAGIGIGPNAGPGLVRNNVQETYNYDAWVLCATLNPNGYCKEKFGPFGIRIAKPVEFFLAVTNSLKESRPLGACTIAGINYEPRESVGLLEIPEDMNFVKPAERFAREEELRMLWETPDGINKLESIIVPCPEVRHLISRLE